MPDSAARIIPLLASQERATALTFSGSQTLPASPRNAATPAAVPLDGNAGQRAPSFACVRSGPAAVDVAASENVVAGLQLRLEELQAENRALTARCAATHGSRRSSDPPAAVAGAGAGADAGADAGRLHSVIEALLGSNRAFQDSHQSCLQTMQKSLQTMQKSLQKVQERHQSSLQLLQQSLVSNQRSLQLALAASQQQVASAQTQNFALAATAGCLGAAFLAVVIARGRV